MNLKKDVCLQNKIWDAGLLKYVNDYVHDWRLK